MIAIENTAVSGWEAAIRGMRNPMNSWEKSDTIWGEYHGDDDGKKILKVYDVPHIGKNDIYLMKRLANAGTEHAKFMRYINVTVDLTAPLYFFKEMDCYRAGVEHNSCSTMHKIQAKEFTLDDFSHEHLVGTSYSMLLNTIVTLNNNREFFLKTKDKEYWWNMIQLLPSSYNQRRTYQFSYQALAAIYKQRKGHKLDEWQKFREWIESLPYSEIITGDDKNV